MLLISKTYCMVTPESAEEGESADDGFVFEDKPMTFRELVSELSEYVSASQSHGMTRHTWFDTCWETDYRDASSTGYSIHFSDKNPESKVKYWVWAAKLAGLAPKGV